METIKKENLKNGLINHITDTIHNFKAENFPEFNLWASSFNKEEADFLVNMEYSNDWGYDTRTEIPLHEVEEYKKILLDRILKNWHR